MVTKNITRNDSGKIVILWNKSYWLLGANLSGYLKLKGTNKLIKETSIQKLRNTELKDCFI